MEPLTPHTVCGEGALETGSIPGTHVYILHNVTVKDAC